jgi:hypothetical protein
VGGFSVDFGGQCYLFPDVQNIQRRNCTVSLNSLSELDVELAEEIL